MTESRPLLSDEQIWAKVLEGKEVPDDWRVQLGPRPPGQRKIAVVGDDGSSFELYARVGLPATSNFSAGLIYVATPSLRYTLVRCNGPHLGGHRNRLEPGRPQIGVTPHVHYGVAKYQRPRDADSICGFAVPTDAFHDLQGALTHLAAVTNLRPTEAMFL